MNAITHTQPTLSNAGDSFRQEVQSAIQRRRAKTLFIPESEVGGFIEDCLRLRARPAPPDIEEVLSGIQATSRYQLACGNWEEFRQLVGLGHSQLASPPGDDQAVTQEAKALVGDAVTVAAQADLQAAAPKEASLPSVTMEENTYGNDTITILKGKYAGEYQVHPIARMFPLIQGEQRDELKKSLKKHGQLEPAVIHHQVFLDGRNRVEIMNELGREPLVVQYSSLRTGIAPEQWMMMKNINRRHLTDDMRLAIAAKCQDWLKEEPLRRIAKATARAVAKGKPKAREGGVASGESQANQAQCAAESDAGEYPQNPAENTPKRRRGRPRGNRSTAEAVATTTGQSRYRAECLMRLREQAMDLAEAVEQGRLTLKQALAKLKERQTPKPTAPEDDKPEHAPDLARVEQALKAGRSALGTIIRKHRVGTWELEPFWLGMAKFVQGEAERSGSPASRRSSLPRSAWGTS